MTMHLPKYDELPIREGLPAGSTWGLWGDDDQLGTINLLTEDAVQRGLSAARRGAVFPLNWALEEPSPPFYGRGALGHRIDRPLDHVLDDALDNFFTQASSQWDALCHVGNPEHGFYNGFQDSDFTGGPGTKLGVEHWARRGIVGRGVLLDLARHRTSTGRPIDGSQFLEFTPDDLEEVCEAQGVTFEVGDILVLRTGWMSWYTQAGDDVRQDLANDSLARLKAPGLVGSEDMVAWLWNHHFAAVAADNPAIEAWPHELALDKYIHFRLLPLIGMPMGEMWYLEDLAADCAEDGVYEFLLTSAPLNLLGGVGSPPNALAIK
jgi:kynurenine formamidase